MWPWLFINPPDINPDPPITFVLVAFTDTAGMQHTDAFATANSAMEFLNSFEWKEASLKPYTI